MNVTRWSAGLAAAIGISAGAPAMAGATLGVRLADVAQDGLADAAPEVDPYLERRAGGRRAKEIPDIAQFLPS